jgi:oxalate decarboxylase/phosphoglucose isomerase-like protein (cupin superfamily)
MLQISNNESYNVELNSNNRLLVNSDYEEIILTEKDLENFCSNHLEYNSFNYLVYRYIYDNSIPTSLNIKFDLTILPPNKNGNPISRTRGHYHLVSKRTSLQYFDIYQVVKGNILFQTHLPMESAEESYFWVGSPGDIFVLPPDMCHVLYNVGKSISVLSNWCSKNEHLDYDTMMKTRGPAFEIESVNNEIINIKINLLFSLKKFTPKQLQPISVLEVINFLGFKSKYIFDWAFEDDSLSIMNKPDRLKYWINSFSKKCQTYNFNIK